MLEFDERVKCIVVNVFCGIFEVMPFVKALVNAKRLDILKKPLVLRVKGHMEDEARKELQAFQEQEIEKKGKSSVYICDEMDEAALLAVKLSI